MNWALQRDFEIPRRVFGWLLAASITWLFIDVLPIPVGLLFAIRYVGRNYETTFLRSLVSGWRVVAACVGMAALGLVFGPKLIIGNNPAGAFGIWLVIGLH